MALPGTLPTWSRGNGFLTPSRRAALFLITVPCIPTCSGKLSSSKVDIILPLSLRERNKSYEATDSALRIRRRAPLFRHGTRRAVRPSDSRHHAGERSARYRHRKSRVAAGHGRVGREERGV